MLINNIVIASHSMRSTFWTNLAVSVTLARCLALSNSLYKYVMLQLQVR